KDEIISQAYLHDDYGLWIVGMVAAGFTAVYMTRLIFLTFYGNERFRTDETVDADAEPAPVEDPDSDPSPTVSYGDPVPVPSGHEPHEAPSVMVFPVVVLAALAAIGGLINLPFTNFEWLDNWLESSFRGVPEVHPDTFAGGASLELLTFA